MSGAYDGDLSLVAEEADFVLGGLGAVAVVVLLLLVLQIGLELVGLVNPGFRLRSYFCMTSGSSLCLVSSRLFLNCLFRRSGRLSSQYAVSSSSMFRRSF